MSLSSFLVEPKKRMLLAHRVMRVYSVWWEGCELMQQYHKEVINIIRHAWYMGAVRMHRPFLCQIPEFVIPNRIVRFNGFYKTSFAYTSTRDIVRLSYVESSLFSMLCFVHKRQASHTHTQPNFQQLRWRTRAPFPIRIHISGDRNYFTYFSFIASCRCRCDRRHRPHPLSFAPNEGDDGDEGDEVKEKSGCKQLSTILSRLINFQEPSKQRSKKNQLKRNGEDTLFALSLARRCRRCLHTT